MVPQESILYLENKKRKVIVHTKDGSYEFYGKLTDVVKSLDERFLHCHRSYAINMEEVAAMEDSRIHFADDGDLYLGRDTFRKTKQQVEEYHKRKKEEE